MAVPFLPPNTLPPPLPYAQCHPPPPYHGAWWYPPPRPPMEVAPHPAPWSHGPPPSKGWHGGSKRRGYGQQSSGAVFECKACDKQYKTRESYSAHLQSHTRCSECEFEGTGKALKEHQLMHILPDELKFSSEEDVRKWREERKRNYPTAENVARKKQLAMEKKERGESAVTPLHRYIQHLIGDDGPGFSRGGRRGRGHRGGRGRSFNQHGYHRPSKKQEPLHQPKLELSSSNPNPNQGSSSCSDEVGDDSNTQESILGAILADCDVLTSSPTGETTSPRVSQQSPTSKRQRLEGVRGRKWTSRRQSKRTRAAVGLEAVQGSRKPTLLEKLLAPEIRHEENSLLQCIHHITINNFFAEQPIQTTFVESCDYSKVT